MSTRISGSRGDRRHRRRLLKLLEIDVAVLFGISLQRLSMLPVAVRDLAPALAILGEECVAQNLESHAGRLVPGSNELIFANARSSVSWTRSSARSTFPDNEIANARKLGTFARMPARTEESLSALERLVLMAHFFSWTPRVWVLIGLTR